MENRETKIITTPVDNHKVVLKEWITGGERRAISSVLLEGSSIKAADLENIDISPDAINKVQDVTFATIVVSVNDSIENIVDVILNMKTKDFDYVVQEVNKVNGGDEELKKK